MYGLRNKVLIGAILLCWIIVSGGWFQLRGDKDLIEGNRLYEDGNYEGASDAYNRALVNSPKDPLVRFNAGTAAYKKGNYEDASRLFKDVIESDDPAIKAFAHYNLGNSLYKLGEAIEDEDLVGTLSYYKEALDSYKEAIRLDPDNMDAKYNYEFLERKIKEIEEKLQEEGNPENNQGQNEDESNQNSQGNNGDEDMSEDKTQNDSQSNENTETGEENPQEQQDETNPEENEGSQESPAGNNDQGQENPPSDSLISSGEDDNGSQMTLEEAIMLLDAAQGEETFMVPYESHKANDLHVEKDW